MAATSVVIANRALTMIGTRKISTLADSSKEARECNANYDMCRRAVLQMHKWNWATKRVVLQGTPITNIVASTGLINVTAAAHGYSTGNKVSITDVIGTQEANGQNMTITVVDANNFTIDGSIFANAYVSGGFTAKSAAFNYNFTLALPSDYVRLHTIQDTSGTTLVEDDYVMEQNFIVTDFPQLWFRYIFDITDTTQFSPLFDEALAAYLAHVISYSISSSDSQKDGLMKDLYKILQQARYQDSVEEPSVTFDDDVWIRSRVGPGQGFVRDPGT